MVPAESIGIKKLIAQRMSQLKRIERKICIEKLKRINESKESFRVVTILLYRTSSGIISVS
jgi:hypothetical protein